MKYPQELVNRYGAKAGILMYVAKELPKIPQTDMVVKTQNESIESILKKADEVPILYPRLFRSSAIEELEGYEGFFPTRMIEDFYETKKRITNPNYFGPYKKKEWFDEHVKQTIESIEGYPLFVKEDEPEKYSHLPDKICVMIAEQSPSSFFGTYIKHPHKDDSYFISITDADSKDPNGEGIDPEHQAYIYMTK